MVRKKDVNGFAGGFAEEIEVECGPHCVDGGAVRNDRIFEPSSDE